MSEKEHTSSVVEAVAVETPATPVETSSTPVETFPPLSLGNVAGVPAGPITSSTPRETSPDEFNTFCQTQAEDAAPPVVVWWNPVVLPKSTALVFAEEDLYLAICESCRSMANVVVNPSSGHVERTFCDSCRIVLGRHGFNRCKGGSPECITFRFVDQVGTVSPLCKGCHHFEQAQRVARRTRSKQAAHKKDRMRTQKTSSKILVEQ